MARAIAKTTAWMSVVILLIGLLSLSGCTPASDPETEEEVVPAKVEHLEGEIPSRITLTDDAAKRIGLQTDEAQAVQVNNTQLVSVPYSAIIYDIEGNIWLYTSDAELIFERVPIVVDHIDGDTVFLSNGLSAGTTIAIQGVAELYGAETEFEEE